ncbi:ferritin-like domain-containing protein [Gemmata sp. JC673]|uniref:Ferritin-like domain-containing protein n=1 Tax=Gemmata algarum TaxID=2975278 RepID=A0ABU5ERW0_9BACT|nr:ferritin-like domain-containing protein [Gemmata algarum]MDY3558082.1 ferritin-like domain-containing protein [Gemmata algarum]
MALDSLHDLYVEELKDLYNAENQLLKALPRMAKAASSDELKAAFTEHLAVTQKQVERLEQIFEGLGVSPKGKKCKAMEGLIEEGKEIMQEDGDPSVIDAALIAAAQRVEHYEMAGYGCVRTFANLLGYGDAEALLQETLDEEGEADKKLTELAETVINVEAESAEGEAGEEDEEAEEPAPSPRRAKPKAGGKK